MSAEPSWGRSPWDAGPPRPPAALPPTCDVVVVGAGLTGLSAALHLARAGADVVVLERLRVGAGASGRTGAIALEGTAAGAAAELGDCLGTLARVVADAGISCGLELGGCWELEHVPLGGSGTALWRDGHQALCLARTEPGGTLDAGALLRGLADAAAAAGARIVEGVAVAPIASGRMLRLASGGTMATGRVVLATGSFTAGLVPMPEGFATALTLAAATDPLDEATLAAIGLADRMPFYTADLPYLWGRLLDDGRLVVGAGLVFPGDGDVDRVRLDDAECRDALERLVGRARGLHPALAGVRASARWGGPVSFRRERQPVVCWHPTVPDVLVTGAYAGHGVALSVRLGALVADAVTTGRALPDWGALGRARQSPS